MIADKVVTRATYNEAERRLPRNVYIYLEGGRTDRHNTAVVHLDVINEYLEDDGAREIRGATVRKKLIIDSHGRREVRVFLVERKTQIGRGMHPETLGVRHSSHAQRLPVTR